MTTETNNKLAEVTQKIIDTLNRYVWFPEKNQDVLVATWIVGTYFHKSLAHFGLLWVTASDMRMGKSVVLKVVANTSFNSEGYLRLGTSVASLFRSCLETTIAIDEYENIPRQLKGELDTILRGGFEAGGAVPKLVEASSGKGKSTVREWVNRVYPVYGPKAIGSIMEQPKTVMDRCFTINMERKTIDKPGLNLNSKEVQAMFQAQRLELTEAANSTSDKVLAEYNPMLEHRPPELHFMIDDRLKDVSLGLLAVAKVAGYEKPLLAALKDQVELRENITSDKAERLEDLLETIDNFLLHGFGNGKKVRARDLSKDAPDNSVLKDAQQMGLLLSSLHCKTSKPKNVVHYEITREFQDRVKNMIS